MEELINSLSKLSVDKDDDINLLCQCLSKVKIDDIKDNILTEEVQEKVQNLPEEAKKILFNFFSILAKKKRCTINTNMITNKLIY
jgi:hypothetical protein